MPVVEDPSIALEEERGLILRCQAGDSQAMGRLYDAHHRALFYGALSMLRSPEAAEDLVQDVFVKLHRVIGQYRFQCRFSHWLLRVGRNAAIDRLRRQKASPVRPPAAARPGAPEPEQAPRDPGPDPEQALEMADEAARVRRAVRELEPRLKEPLVMALWGGLSYQQVSESLGISQGTVKSRIFRAKRALARGLA